MKALRYGALAALLTSGGAYAVAAPLRTVTSPDGSIELSLTLDDNDRQLRYEVKRGGVTLVNPSAVGLQVSTGNLNSFSSGVDVTVTSGDETYTLPHGKTSLHRNNYNEITVAGVPGTGSGNLSVTFRVYDDAVGFRYGLTGHSNLQVISDLSEFNIAAFRTSWAQSYHKDYSWYYEPRTWSEMTQVDSYNVPVLIECSDDNYILLTEAAATPAMSASSVYTADGSGQLRLRPASASVIADDNFLSPWRTMLIGPLTAIVESSRIADFNAAPQIDDLSWIKPGRVAWNWGAEDGDGSPTMEQARRYIDMAATMGWEYFLLDDGWDGRLDLSEVVEYADSRNVGLLIWSHQNRFINNYTQIYSILRHWSNLGVKGVKIDFFEDDRQEMLQKYELILRAAAQCRLMVNFHGCTKPSGLERTWPHLMTNEAVLGGEFYMFNTTMTPGSHTVNLALTRNVLGSMDYTPVKFGSKKGRVITNTTWAYQLALSVIVESALQSFCDTPENIIGSVAEPFLRQVPVAWDELKCLEAKPDNYVTLARRSGGDWWIGSLTQNARKTSIDLSFLNPGTLYHAHIYTEGFHRSDIAYECRTVSADDCIELELGDNSGASVMITPAADAMYPFTVKMEAEKFNRYCDRVQDSSYSGGVAVQGPGGVRRKVEFTNVSVPADGEYNLTLYYSTTAECECYVAVNGGEHEYHSFTNTGKSLYFVTMPVTLTKGDNTITLSNDNGAVSDLIIDRAVVSGIMRDGGQSGIEAVETAGVIPVIVADGAGLSIDTPHDGRVTVYSLSGMRLDEAALVSGHNVLTLSARGPVIVNVTTGTNSISKKIIIK